MPCIGVAAIFYGLGLITAVIFYAWLDEREDPYCGIVIPDKQVTAIEWTLRKQSIPDKYAILSKKKVVRGHLGHFDHRAQQRCLTWIKDVKPTCHGPALP
jgi:hypothetical protein